MKSEFKKVFVARFAKTGYGPNAILQIGPFETKEAAEQYADRWLAHKDKWMFGSIREHTISITHKSDAENEWENP